MRLLVLTRYDSMGAASRQRFIQYFPYLRAHGIDVVHAPLLSNADQELLYAQGRRDWLGVAQSYLRRIALMSRGYDLIWLEKELFPLLPAIGERWMRGRYVVDYDDAVFHNYDMHRRWLVRHTLGHKIDAVMRNATLVVAGNDYLAARAREAGASRVEVIPTVVDATRYQPLERASARAFTVGWIGSPSTTKYLETLGPTLATLSSESETRLVAVGAATSLNVGRVPVDQRPWAEEREVADIQAMDVGVMPLPDGPWERGKCGYKLIQYMACGLPVVASPVGVNAEIASGCGFVASSPKEWTASLRRLRDDVQLRATFGRAGRAKVEQTYCLAAAAPKLLELLSTAAERGRA